MSRPTVFVSYSHRDEVWKDRLRPQLGVLQRAGHIAIWDDRRIGAGSTWYDEIKRVMDQAAVAVCLISADYLDSDFVTKEEIPYLLERRQWDGMVLIPVLVRPCPWEVVPWLEPTQMLPRDGKSVAEDFQGKEDGIFAEVARTILRVMTDSNYRLPAPPPPRWPPPEKIDLTRLPATGAELFGRQRELELLDEAWQSDGAHIVSLVAWGGVGKSTLVNKWLEQLAVDNYRGARRVFGWSFHSQGAGERVTAADQFFEAALGWFGDPDPKVGSPWDKAERLADLARREKTLLLLDGLEPLQSPDTYERGQVKDPALATLLTELARRNHGLCVITTRLPVADLAAFEDTTQQVNLEQMSAQAGRALLRIRGVQGTDAELEGATREFGHHALALNLLAAWLQDIPGRHILHASGVPDLDIPEAEGKHPRRLMLAFERRFGAGPELELLRMLGLFDRPADGRALEALRSAPAIADLTVHLHGLSEVGWMGALERLRRSRSIAAESKDQPDSIDAHPLIREHFGERLRRTQPLAWRLGNDRLYEHLKGTTKEFPDSLAEMAPLHTSLIHACRAGRQQEALVEVYWRRILREREYFSTRKLGAFGADLAALSGFFEVPWTQPIGGLTEAAKGFVLFQAGLRLRALGRPVEAAEPLQASLRVRIQEEDWRNAAGTASNVSELYLTLGDLDQALAYAKQGLELAERSRIDGERIGRRPTLATALHQAGRSSDAEAVFREAERMQQTRQPDFPLLFSSGGFRYSELLLDQGKYQEVHGRGLEVLKRAERSGASPLSIGLTQLTLGRALLRLAQEQRAADLTEATHYLERAVENLQRAGRQDFLPLGLLARMELRRVQGDLDRSQSDLDRGMTIATRGGMGLHQADCHLGYARLHLARGSKEAARESLGTAREMIERMGYHRRDREVEELGRELA